MDAATQVDEVPLVDRVDPEAAGPDVQRQERCQDGNDSDGFGATDRTYRLLDSMGTTDDRRNGRRVRQWANASGCNGLRGASGGQRASTSIGQRTQRGFVCHTATDGGQREGDATARPLRDEYSDPY